MKPLPAGTWLSLNNLDPRTTEQDVQDLLAGRTGVILPLERISLNEYGDGKAAAIISLAKPHIRDFLNWALAEDSLYDRSIQVVVPHGEDKPQVAPPVRYTR
jgi:hypothetical protein